MAQAVRTARFMAEPITPEEELNKNAEDMKTKMELMIMKIQVKK